MFHGVSRPYRAAFSTYSPRNMEIYRPGSHESLSSCR